MARTVEMQQSRQGRRQIEQRGNKNVIRILRNGAVYFSKGKGLPVVALSTRMCKDWGIRSNVRLF